MSPKHRARGETYPYSILGVLFLVSVFHFVDRWRISVLRQPIKEEFSVSQSGADSRLRRASHGTSSCWRCVAWASGSAKPQAHPAPTR